MSYQKAQLERVMVALDYETPEKAYRLVDDLGELVDWYKIGPVLFTRSGEEIIRFLQKRNKKIFLDLKIYDTPAVVSTTIKQIADIGVLFTSLHCMGGRRMLETAGEACRGTQLKILGVTLLTSEESSIAEVQKLVRLAADSRLSGVLCSPHETEAVRREVPPGFLLVTAGIRMPGEEVFQDDQKRVASPRQALEWGSDFLIVGRPITQAREPRDVVLRLFER